MRMSGREYYKTFLIWPSWGPHYAGRAGRRDAEADEDRGNVETFESDRDDVDVEWSKRCPVLEGLCKGLGPLVGFLVVERKMLTLTPSADAAIRPL